MSFDTIIAYLLAATIAYAVARAYLQLRALDRLIWYNLQHDPEGAPTQPHNGHDTFHTHILTVAKRYLGVTEQPKGSNRGPFIDDFIRFTGLQPPQPWCAAYVSFVVHKAAEELNITTDFPKTAWTPTILNWARKSNKLITQQELQLGAKPKQGDIFLLYYPALNRVAHTGFVERALPFFVVTIEGNTNDEGGREGYKVARRIRRLKSIYALVRL